MERCTWIVVCLSTWSLFGGISRAEDSSALERAYRKEYAFLEAEKRALTERLAEVSSEGEAKLQAAQRDLERLSATAMGMTLKADGLSERLSEVERLAEVSADGDDLLDSTLSQAQVALNQGGVELSKADTADEASDVDPVDTRSERMDEAFEGALQLLDQYGRVRTEKSAAFFGAGGEKLTGSIVRIGNVAAYGIGSERGALAPAGGGRLKVFNSDLGRATAEALGSGKKAPTLGLFLFESLDNNFEAKKDKTWFQIVQSGGVIAWVIVALGLVALLMLLARLVILVSHHANIERWVTELTPLVRSHQYGEAIARCERASSAPGRVMAATLRHLHCTREQLEDIVSEQMLAEAPRLDRFAQMVIVLAAVAPLLGLLGTVTGMISTFDVITEFGTGNPKLLSGGISEALVTTELGLIVAIPALLGGNMLAAWGERIKTEIDRGALRLSNIAFAKPEASTDNEPLAPAPQLAPAE